MNMSEIKTQILSKFPSANLEYLELYLNVCSKSSNTEYKESHHVLPKSLWPEFSNLTDNPWNKIQLSGYDHLFAHYWFSKSTNSIWRAVHSMCQHHKEKRYHNCTHEQIEQAAKLYEEFRLNYSHSESTREKISIANKGKTKGVPKQEIHKLRISEALKRHTRTEEHCEAIRLSKLGKPQPNVSAAKKGKPSTHLQVQSRRKSPVWHEPLYSQLFSLWQESGNLKFIRFENLAVSKGFPASKSYRKLVRDFNNKISR